ncbi:MAG TPA: hypothetical protein PK402_09295 [Tepidisphaeraceae bacterium]|nr:hypothetical protein [Tepidisphaeraceae bacterium]
MVETHSKALTRGLYINATLLLAILVALIVRSNGLDLASPAYAQQVPQPIAGGAGFFLMPAQFATNKWGCYVMDVDAQTLVAYEYNPGDRTLRLSAARSFVYDRQLKEYNTGSPTPSEVAKLVEMERNKDRQPQIVPNDQGNEPANDPAD